MHGLSGRHLILLPFLAGACQSFTAVRIEPKGSGVLPTHSWVILEGGARVPVENGMFSRDSIVGSHAAGMRFAVSRDSVAFVEARPESASSPALGALKWTALALVAGFTLLLMVGLSELQ